MDTGLSVDIFIFPPPFPGKLKIEEKTKPMGQRRIQYVAGVPGGTWRRKELWQKNQNSPKKGQRDTFMMALIQGTKQRGANGRKSILRNKRKKEAKPKRRKLSK
eukprot:13398209-Ditylum_brightwellii.AAC.1